MLTATCRMALLAWLGFGASAWAEARPSSTAAHLRPLGPAAMQAQSPSAPRDGRIYSDTLTPLREDVRAYERDPVNRYAYCIRNVGTYECLSYGSDGNVRRRQHKKIAHGTGVAYQIDKDETRILTNEHVIAWPAITDSDHEVDDISTGCKLINQKLSIVDNENDEYDADDIPLTRLIEDRALDAAVVRAKVKLRVIPYRIGHSSALSSNDVVVVRGFPLGVFQAYNTGKVINTRDDDLYRQWDHLDFIIDAQLSAGGSGSPVLALNRTTGEYELVGIFHASYARANGLNAVIAIDQLRDLMFQLKRSDAQRTVLEPDRLSDDEQRRRLQAALQNQDYVPFVQLGPLTVRVHSLGDALLFEIFSKEFPLSEHRVALMLDAPAIDGWGKLQQVWFGNSRGYKAYCAAALKPDTAVALTQTLRRLYALSMSTLRYREVARQEAASRQAVELRTRLEGKLTRAAAQDSDFAQQILDASEDAAPSSATIALPLAEALAQARQPATAVAPAHALAQSSQK